MITGRIHSFQSLGAVDGPGIRFVLFLQGCPLRCMYCHNPDTWNPNGGTEYTVDEVLSKILRYRPYFKDGGGVTVSGGEALLQWEFVTELFTRLHAEHIHTCLDTSGIGPSEGFVPLLSVTDLVLCDIKFTTEKDYLSHTKGSLSKVCSFLSVCQSVGVPIWIRHVVVPGYTDTEEEIRAMANIAAPYRPERIELLPFHKLCIPKYEALGIPFPCADIPECDPDTLTRLQKLLELQ